MSEHLNLEELSKLVAGEILWPNRQLHLDNCPQCAAELGESRSQLAEFRQSVRAAADHQEAFWARQRYVIGCRLQEASQWHRMLRPAWIAAASAALMFFVFAISIASLHRSRNSDTTTAQISSQSDSDDLLLANVQEELQRDVPAALEPAHLLMQHVPAAEPRAHRLLNVNSSSPLPREF